MSERSLDWFRQAESDGRHARNSFEDGDYGWACFASQQAAEKGLKAVYLLIPLDVNIVVYTEKEIEKMLEKGNRFVREILDGLPL